MPVYLHTQAGYGGAALARFFKVPRTTAYGWISWFESLPEGLRGGILAFMAAQVPVMTAYHTPTVTPKAKSCSTPVGAVPGQPSPRGADMGSGKGPAGGGVPVVKSGLGSWGGVWGAARGPDRVPACAVPRGAPLKKPFVGQ